jgi:flagellar hook-length control protein FliK
MTAQFAVQNELSKEALESQMQTLKDALNQQGIKVDSIEVTVQANAFNENAPEDKDSRSKEKNSETDRKITMEEAFSMNETPQEDSFLPESDGLRGSRIDATA